MPAFMKYTGVDGSTEAPAHDDLIIFSYSTGPGSQAGADLRKGTWLTDVTHEDAPAGDGTSNTFMYAEKYPLEDDGYVLTAIQHGSVDTLQGGTDGAQNTPGALLFIFSQEPTAQDTASGSYVLYQDVVVPPIETGPALAVESLTIAHEGFWLI